MPQFGIRKYMGQYISYYRPFWFCLNSSELVLRLQLQALKVVLNFIERKKALNEVESQIFRYGFFFLLLYPHHQEQNLAYDKAQVLLFNELRDHSDHLIQPAHVTGSKVSSTEVKSQSILVAEPRHLL